MALTLKRCQTQNCRVTIWDSDDFCRQCREKQKCAPARLAEKVADRVIDTVFSKQLSDVTAVLIRFYVSTVVCSRQIGFWGGLLDWGGEPDYSHIQSPYQPVVRKDITYPRIVQ